MQVLELHRQLAIALHREKETRLGQPVERLAEVLADRAADVRSVRDKRIERAVLRDQLHRRLRADLVDARHVVDGIADQRVIIDDELRGHAELLLHAFDIELLVGHGVDQRDALVDELREVLVAGRNHAVHAGCLRLASQRRNYIVGLHPIHGDDRPAQRGDDFPDRLNLGGEVVGHR